MTWLVRMAVALPQCVAPADTGLLSPHPHRLERLVRYSSCIGACQRATCATSSAGISNPRVCGITYVRVVPQQAHARTPPPPQLLGYSTHHSPDISLAPWCAMYGFNASTLPIEGTGWQDLLLVQLTPLAAAHAIDIHTRSGEAGDTAGDSGWDAALAGTTGVS